MLELVFKFTYFRPEIEGRLEMSMRVLLYDIDDFLVV